MSSLPLAEVIMQDIEIVKKIIASRRRFAGRDSLANRYNVEAEGGCGVTGFASSIPVGGRHIFKPSVQMHNRGNGKGGGIAAVGLCADDLGVSQDILQRDYLLQVAFLDPAARDAVEQECLKPFLKIDKSEKIPMVKDFRAIEGLETQPPDVWRYFVRVKEAVLKSFIEKHNLQKMLPGRAEDEFISQNTYHLNQKFYASLGEKKAFVLSHGRDMMILKIVGYAEQVAQYYQLEDLRAHLWIAHQRYPTKGRVWHPGGAHPFIGMDEALVHNGDFANYHSVTEYLQQRNIYPQFLTDTEVSVLLFDLWNRIYGYPLEYIIEALAPTGEMDFDLLPPEKQRIYRAIQATHLHSSPDGPWFFIIARNDPYAKCYQLIGITDTSMLRPQVFALQEGEVQIGLICSEKQAIDATLHSLSEEDKRFSPIADKYWNARGGSHTDGGAFLFTLQREADSHKIASFTCTDKFGKVIATAKDQRHHDRAVELLSIPQTSALEAEITKVLTENNTWGIFTALRSKMKEWDFETFGRCCQKIVVHGCEGNASKEQAIQILTWLMDFRYDTGSKKRSSILEILRICLDEIFIKTAYLSESSSDQFSRVDWETRKSLRGPGSNETTLIVDVKDFPPEGEDCDARFLCEAHAKGWRRFIIYGYRGQRFCGCGFGPRTKNVRIDVYGSSGDYLGSGIDGMEIYVHGNAQDQLGQIMKSGKMVIFGDVGQTFLYGAKGGEVYVQGNAAGRPLINAVGSPRVVINGTCLDYLAESFMAGDPFRGGGFVVLNGLAYDDHGMVKEQASPYPGSNLFSLASGGAIYVRDPHGLVVAEQLNGGEFVPFSEEDWHLILPYLEENEQLFGISIEHDILRVNGELQKPEDVYRKVGAIKLAVLTDLEDGE